MVWHFVPLGQLPIPWGRREARSSYGGHMKHILWQLVAPIMALGLALIWWLLVWRGADLNEIPMRTETFITSPYAVWVFVGMGLALALSRVRSRWALGLAALLLIVQLLFWPARFSQTSWIGYGVLIPLIAIVSRRIDVEMRRRAFMTVLLGACAVAALLSVPSLSMKGTESTTYGKPWSVEPAVAENIAVWVVLCVGLASAAWVLGRPRSDPSGVTILNEAVVPAASNEAFSALTPRERETFMLVARGQSNAEIAQHLFITEATVKSHVGSLLTKLELTSRSGLIAYAYDQRIILPTHPSSPVNAGMTTVDPERNPVLEDGRAAPQGS